MEEYVYLTYSLKNDKGEESRILLESYKTLLQKSVSPSSVPSSGIRIHRIVRILLVRNLMPAPDHYPH